MYNKYYTVEWTIDFDDRCYSDRKRFEADEREEMEQLILDLAHKEGISKIWKNTVEEITFQLFTKSKSCGIQ